MLKVGMRRVLPMYGAWRTAFVALVLFMLVGMHALILGTSTHLDVATAAAPPSAPDRSSYQGSLGGVRTTGGGDMVSTDAGARLTPAGDCHGPSDGTDHSLGAAAVCRATTADTTPEMQPPSSVRHEALADQSGTLSRALRVAAESQPALTLAQLSILRI